MDYAATLEYLFTRLPLFSRQGPAAYKKDLHHIIALCKELGDPQNSFRTIHVAGTNGKGSVSHMLASVFQAAGYRTGLYTSPHLYDFRERIRVDGLMIPEHNVIDFTEKMRGQIESMQPSFFEVTVAMAFDHFAKEKVDIAIIEVGLGGRLDSTNIIDPELSVITNIGWDHMNMLGDTLQHIAREKAGIIKKGRPVVIGREQPELLPLFREKASEMDAPLYEAYKYYAVTQMQLQTDTINIEVRKTGDGSLKQYTLDLPGQYQRENLCTVLTAIDILKELDWQLEDAIVTKALQQTSSITGLHGRWEVCRRKPLLVLEVAHNTDGIKALLQQVALLQHHHLHLVFGMVRDKDVMPVLELLPKNASYYFSQANIPRALPLNELLECAAAAGLQGRAFADVNDAVDAALNAAVADDLIVVCGSIFLVAEVDRKRFARK